MSFTPIFFPSVAIPAMNIDWTIPGVFTKTLAAGANTFTFSNASDGMNIVVVVTGAASTLTWPAVTWVGGSGSAPTQTASGTDVYTFVKAGSTIYGAVSPAVASSGAASAGGAGQVQTSDGAGGFTAPTNVLAGTDFVSLGASPALAGNIRLPNAGVINSLRAAGGVDIPLLHTDASDVVWLGDTTVTTTLVIGSSGYARVRSYAMSIQDAAGSVDRLLVTSSTVESAYPVIGGNSTPYGVHGKVKITLSGNHTLSAAEYAMDTIELNGSLATSPVITVPAATDAKKYKKSFRANWTNTSTATVATITTGVGNTATLTFGGLGGGQASQADFEVNADGVTKVSGQFP